MLEQPDNPYLTPSRGYGSGAYGSGGPYGGGGTHGGGGQALLPMILSLLYRNYPIIVGLALLGLLAGLAYVAVAPSRYTASGVIHIEPRQQPFEDQKDRTPTETAAAENQLQVLTSDAIAEKVIRNLNLLHDPEFGGVVEDELPDEDRMRIAVLMFQPNLTVERTGVELFSISFRSLSPQRSVDIVNAVIQAHGEYELEMAYGAATASARWLQARLDELRDQVFTAERAVEDFKTANNIVESNGKLITDQQVEELSAQLVVARQQKDDAAARVQGINAMIAEGTGDGPLTETLQNDVLARLRQQLVEVEARERDFSARFGRNHEAVVNLRNEIRQIRASMVSELRRIADAYQRDFGLAGAKEQAIQVNLDAAVKRARETAEAQVALRRLESSAATYRTIYDSFLQRHTRTLQQQSLASSVVRVVGPPSLPDTPSHPRRLLIIALALGGGLAGGLGIAIARELTDRVVRTAPQIESMWETECLAVLPEFGSAPALAAPSKWRRALDRVVRPIIALIPFKATKAPAFGDEKAKRFVIDEPFSRYAEGMRSVKLAIDLAAASPGRNTIGITSSLSEEGKTTVAANLARSIAQTGGRTILVDCDLRNPSLSRSLAAKAEFGLVEVLGGTKDLFAAIRKDTVTGLDILPVVSTGPLANTNEMISSHAMKEVLEDLRKSYDYVILDMPPLVPIVDARISITLVDSMIFVVRWGSTKVDVISHALSRAKFQPGQLLGVVLNRVDMEVLGRFEQYGGKYYSNDQYSARYGVTA